MARLPLLFCFRRNVVIRPFPALPSLGAKCQQPCRRAVPSASRECGNRHVLKPRFLSGPRTYKAVADCEDLSGRRVKTRIILFGKERILGFKHLFSKELSQLNASIWPSTWLLASMVPELKFDTEELSLVSWCSCGISIPRGLTSDLHHDSSLPPWSPLECLTSCSP